MPMEAPRILSENKDDRTLDLGWSPADYRTFAKRVPITYVIEVQTPPSSDWKRKYDGIKDNNYTIKDVDPLQDYKFRVIAENEFGPSSPSLPVDKNGTREKPREIPPLPPAEMPTFSDLKDTSLRLSWLPAERQPNTKPSPLWYNIEVCSPSDNDWSKLSSNWPDPFYDVRGLDPLKNYNFRVRAENDFGLSDPSPIAEFKRTPKEPPKAKEPQLFLPPNMPVEAPYFNDRGDDFVLLSWAPANDEPNSKPSPITYTIEYQDPPLSEWKTLTSDLPDPSYKIGNLDPGKDYRYRVFAVNEFGKSSPTIAVTREGLRDLRAAVPPRAPAEVPYFSEPPEGLTLNWYPSSYPTYAKPSPITYTVERQDPPSPDWYKVAGGIPDTFFRLTDLNPDNDYKFRIRAENEFGVSEPSLPVKRPKLKPQKPAEDMLPGLPPLGLKEKPWLSDISDNDCVINWAPSGPAEGSRPSPIHYGIDIMEPNSSDWTPYKRGLDGPSYRIGDLNPEKDYRFRVIPENEFGQSVPSLGVTKEGVMDLSVGVPPRSPFDAPTISNSTGTDLTLSWFPSKLSPNAKPSPISYIVEMQSPPAFTWNKLVGGLPDTTYDVHNLLPEDNYQFRVRAENEYGQSEPSLPVKREKPRTKTEYLALLPPYAPRGTPYISDVGKSDCVLNWEVALPQENSKPSPITYHIESNTPPMSSWKRLRSDLPDTKFRISNLDPHKDYQFRVKAVNDFGSSEPTPAVKKEGVKREEPDFDQTIAVPPRAPLDVPYITNLADTSFTLNWSPARLAPMSKPSPITYSIEVQDPPSFDWKKIFDGISDTCYNIGDIDPKKDYRYRVRAHNEFGVSEPTMAARLDRREKEDEYALTVPPRSPPDTPFFTDKTDTSVILNWSPAKPAAYGKPSPITYIIEFQELPDFDWKRLKGGINDTSHPINNLDAGRDYRFRVRAENEFGVSEPSTSVHRDKIEKDEDKFITVPPKAPSDIPYFTNRKPESLTLNWNPARMPPYSKPSPITYIIEVLEPTDMDWRRIHEGIDGISFDLDGLDPNKEYKYRIRAHNEYGNSEPSMTVRREKPKRDDDHLMALPPRSPPDAPHVINLTDNSFTLTWSPSDVPTYGKKSPITYSVEYQEPHGYTWKKLVDGLSDPTYGVKDFKPDLGDWKYRVRASNEYGTSEPTRHVTVGGKKEKTIEDLYGRGAPPRMPSDVPKITNATHKGLALTWKKAKPATLGKPGPCTYIVEYQEPPSGDWKRKLEDIKELTADIPDLDPSKEYRFRIRAKNEYGESEPGRSAYRDRLLKDTVDHAPFGGRRGSSTFTREAPPLPPTEAPYISQKADNNVVLCWGPGKLSPYCKQVPIKYIVEMQTLPSVEWKRVQDGIPECTTQVNDLVKDKDYKFRVKSQNEFGESEPSRPCFRERQWDIGFDKPDSGLAVPPSFVYQEEGDLTQYGVEGYTAKVTCTVHAWPHPRLKWFLNGEKIDLGGRYSAYLDDKGVCTLEFDHMSWDDVGTYKCYAENEYGESSWTVKFEMADPPTFLEPLKNLTIPLWGSGKLECRVDGLPYPKLSWNKDWRTLPESHRIRIKRKDKDHWVLSLDNVIGRDTGLYICVAENIAGKVHCIANVTIDEKATFLSDIQFKPTKVEDFYHTLEEIGRGRYGIVRRMIEKSTGCEFAAKFLRARNEKMKEELRHEMETLRLCKHRNIVDLVDAYETERRIVLVMELVNGPELVDKVIAEDSWTESEAAFFVRQILDAVRHMHSHNVLHLDLKLENIHLANNTSDEIKVTDFGFARRYNPKVPLKFHYGTPEFAAPETVNDDSVSYATDVWSVGVIAYILLSGLSPFGGASDKETLEKIQKVDWSFDSDVFANISDEAKDFVTRILQLNPLDRMSVEECLMHPFIQLAENRGEGPKINLDRLHVLHTRSRWLRVAGHVKNVVQMKPLSELMVDIPMFQVPQLLIPEMGLDFEGERPPPTPLREGSPSSTATFEHSIFSPPGLMSPPGLFSPPPSLLSPGGAAGGLAPGGWGEYASSEGGASSHKLRVMRAPSPMIIGSDTVTSGSEDDVELQDEDNWAEWSTMYQQGPDTCLLPLGDKSLPVRLRAYKRSDGKPHPELNVQIPSIDSPILDSSVDREYQIAQKTLQERRTLKDVDKENLPKVKLKKVKKKKVTDRTVGGQMRMLVEEDDDEDDTIRRRSAKSTPPKRKRMGEVCPPVFREKVNDTAYSVGDYVTLKCRIVGSPHPSVTWYRNEELLHSGGRVRCTYTSDGRASLTVLSAKPNDEGIYKCVARNKLGRVSCRARLLVGDIPERPGRPTVTQVSSQEAFIIWDAPKSDGNTHIIAYKVDYRRHGDDRWTTGTYTIGECALINNLEDDTIYRFRVSCINQFGASPYSWASIECKTKSKGAANLDIDQDTKRILLRSRQATERPSPTSSPSGTPRAMSPVDGEDIDVDKVKGADREVFLQEITPEKFYDFHTELWRGKFSIIRNCHPIDGSSKQRAAKISLFNSEKEKECLQEYEVLKLVRQEHIVRLLEAFQTTEYVCLIFEKLHGEDVTRYLSFKTKYTEELVSKVIRQVMDAIQYLHHHGIVHLNLAPANILMVSRRRLKVKVIDFGCAQQILTDDGEPSERHGRTEFMAPEMVNKDLCGVGADIWGIGVLTFILLSGVSPFRGESDEETTSNINYLNYDAHDLYDSITKEALKFIYQTLKRVPVNRLTLEECLDHKFLQVSKKMVEKRENTIFSTNRIKQFAEEYRLRRKAEATRNDQLLHAFGCGDAASAMDSDVDI
ncbi:unnamed protein product [Owenia fusiformis]|uniref:Uncharacterized protein n=1 Tax=Owenia fusiformis TaxID=6347 RepID=A0A8J1UG38_OWEFU|nr:unnamed protein product [Owenia fusiformis]